MPYNPKYRNTEYRKRAEKNYDEKVITIRFRLNIPQTIAAIENHGDKSNANARAKKLFLDDLAAKND